MINFETSLGENFLTNLMFSLIEKFSTQKPFQIVLRDIFYTIGRALDLWVNADVLTHVFSNQRMTESHRLECTNRIRNDKKQSGSLPVYEFVCIKPNTPNFKPTAKAMHWKPKEVFVRNNDPLLHVALSLNDRSNLNQKVWISQLDFSMKSPLGYFCLCWLEEPELKDTDIYHIQTILHRICGALSALMRNHYSFQSEVYFPSYYAEGYKSAAILFADIRNSTSLFETARLGGLQYMQSVDIFLKVWLGYAAEYISDKKIGYIHGFSGDGFMATFGEYIVGTESQPCFASHRLGIFKSLF